MQGGSSQPLHCRLTCLLLLLQLPMWVSSDKFHVIGPTDPIVAQLGTNAMLPCLLSPPMSAENMELRWFRSKFTDAVFIYQNGQEQEEGQMAEYAGRTSLVRDFLTRGQVAVHIDNIQVSDNGMYTCFFKKGDSYEEATLELKVAAIGSAPEVFIEGQEEDGVRLGCRALGWFPKPQVQWRYPSGEKFLAFSEDHVQDADGLFHVEASLVVRDSTARNVTCSILHPILGEEKMKTISIPESFFPQASPWKAAFAVILSFLVLLILAAGYFLKKEHLAKVQMRKSKEELQAQKEELQAQKDELQVELEWKKAVHQAALRKNHLDVDLLKKYFKAWSFTLDPHSAHSKLILSQENRTLTLKDTCVSQNKDSCSVLGCEGITSGRWYWEVEIRNGETGKWAMGVCREEVNRTNNIVESPENGFWIVRWWLGDFYAHPTGKLHIGVRQFSFRVGVFLDYNDGNVFFYNLSDGSYIHSFSLIFFTGTVFPYFKIEAGNTSLSICSAAGSVEGLPVALNNSSFQESTNLPGEGSSSGFGGDCAQEGPESSLLPDASEALSPQGPSTVSVPEEAAPLAEESLR